MSFLMTGTSKLTNQRSVIDSYSTTNTTIRLSIATKLVLTFLLIITTTSAIFTGVVIYLIDDHIEADIQEQVREDLNNVRDLYLSKLIHINSVMISTAGSSSVNNAVATGNIETIADEITGTKIQERLDFFSIADDEGNVLYRASNPGLYGDNMSSVKFLELVLKRKMASAAAAIISTKDLMKEVSSNTLPESSTTMTPAEAMYSQKMVLGAAAPIIDSKNDLIGVAYGGIILNDNIEFICEISQSIYHNRKYEDHAIGFVSIYQGPTGILTCPKIERGAGPAESRVPETVYDDLVSEGKPFASRELVHDTWYVTNHEPIRNIDYEVIGLLQVGQLEQRYLDIRNQVIVAFSVITMIVAIASVLFAYFVSRRISVPLNKLVYASRNIAHGDLEARVYISSHDELGELAQSFNTMATALQDRDEKLKELTRHRIRRSERLAIIGKLSANVAHELNNPLQGIVTYAHLLLERMPENHRDTDYLQIIVTQADRCRDIIRGLLDFSRQREPEKTKCHVNDVLMRCVFLLEKQALFHNIDVIKDFEVDLPLALIDPAQIERVFLNMLVNAAEAMNGLGRMTLVTRFDPDTEQIEVLISDTGHGIAEEDLKNIFDPFYTTKEVGQGTGLGLAISYGIIMEHGATISVESEVGKGTTFTVCFPDIVSERVV